MLADHPPEECDLLWRDGQRRVHCVPVPAQKAIAHRVQEEIPGMRRGSRTDERKSASTTSEKTGLVVTLAALRALKPRKFKRS